MSAVLFLYSKERMERWLPPHIERRQEMIIVIVTVIVQIRLCALFCQLPKLLLFKPVLFFFQSAVDLSCLFSFLTLLEHPNPRPTSSSLTANQSRRQQQPQQGGMGDSSTGESDRDETLAYAARRSHAFQIRIAIGLLIVTVLLGALTAYFVVPILIKECAERPANRMSRQLVRPAQRLRSGSADSSKPRRTGFQGTTTGGVVNPSRGLAGAESAGSIIPRGKAVHNTVATAAVENVASSYSGSVRSSVPEDIGLPGRPDITSAGLRHIKALDRYYPGPGSIRPKVRQPYRSNAVSIRQYRYTSGTTVVLEFTVPALEDADQQETFEFNVTNLNASMYDTKRAFADDALFASPPETAGARDDFAQRLMYAASAISLPLKLDAASPRNTTAANDPSNEDFPVNAGVVAPA